MSDTPSPDDRLSRERVDVLIEHTRAKALDTGTDVTDVVTVAGTAMGLLGSAHEPPANRSSSVSFRTPLAS